MIRALAAIAALALLCFGAVLGYISIIALRRSEGVFLPAGCVAAACLVAGTLLLRWVLRL